MIIHERFYFLKIALAHPIAVFLRLIGKKISSGLFFSLGAVSLSQIVTFLPLFFSKIKIVFHLACIVPNELGYHPNASDYFSHDFLSHY